MISLPAHVRPAPPRRFVRSPRLAMPLDISLGLTVQSLEAAGGAPAFSPSSLSPSAWWDGLDGSTQFSDVAGTTPSIIGGAVQLWKDKSGFANDISQATTSNAATLRASGLSYDGADRYAIKTLTQGSIAQPYTWIVVCDIQSNLSMFFDNGTGVTRNLAQRGSTAATEMMINAGASVLRTGTPSVNVRRAWYLFFSGASSTIKCGTSGSVTQQGAAGNAGTNPCTDVRIGGNASNFLLTGTGANEGMGELILVPRALTTQEETNLYTYFVARHGIA